MKAKVEIARNGIILKSDDDTIVYQSGYDEDEYERWQEFLVTLTDLYGPPDSRYNPKRIYIIVAPGDKWPGQIRCPLSDHPVCPCDL